MTAWSAAESVGEGHARLERVRGELGVLRDKLAAAEQAIDDDAADLTKELDSKEVAALKHLSLDLWKVRCRIEEAQKRMASRTREAETACCAALDRARALEVVLRAIWHSPAWPTPISAARFGSSTLDNESTHRDTDRTT